MNSTEGEITVQAPSLLGVERLSAYYGPLRALWGVSIQVSRGEVIAILGPNGAGKTTLLRAISGMRVRREGEIVFDGRSIAALPTHQVAARGVMHVPEGRRLFPTMTVDDNLDMGAYLVRVRSEIEGRRAWVFDLFPVLGQRRSSLAGYLSGGEQQMLAIGRALMARPRLIMMDEPSLGLSPVVADMIFDVLGRIAHEDVGILLAEQQVAAALEVADRAYVLRLGRVQLEGAAQQMHSSLAEVEAAYMEHGTQ
jgi:branched-chain amino acid transport system ATP-binding protein